jgi:hypothetical protein
MARGAVPNPQDTIAARAARAERAAAACRLSVAGWSYDRIVREGNLGYNNRQAVYRDVKRVLTEKAKEQSESAAVKRARELALLDDALEVAHRIMNAEHLAHGNGRVVRRNLGTEDEPDWADVIDNGPNLAAADRLIKISESRRKLLGLDAPTKVQQQVEGTVSYVINAQPEELEQL